MPAMKKDAKTAPQQLSKEERRLLDMVLCQESTYCDLPLNQLQIDFAYQERPRETLMRQIAEQFSPVLFGALIVSRRPDGSLWVCDGATRVLGMRLKLGERWSGSVRCQVLNTDGQRQEALLFKVYNSKLRRTVPLATRFQAEHVARTDQGFGKIVTGAGFKFVGTGRNKLNGPGFAREAFDDKRIGPDALQRALFTFKATWGQSKQRIDGQNIKALAILYSQYSCEDQMRQLLKRLTPADVDEKTNRVWGGGKRVGARLHPADRPHFVAKALALECNKSNHGKFRKLNLDMIDEMRLVA